MIVIIEADTGKLNSKYNYDADMILTSHIILSIENKTDAFIKFRFMYCV